ncbi:zinc knuckle [Stagonosporopsis vannaccii]|nr:zinc knuckle [Stagonosporopsis vannaccii]
MGRTQVFTLQPGMASNPYRSMKEQVPQKTLCELCDRTINTRDWPQHKNSKAHRALEKAEKDKEHAKANSNYAADAWGGEPSGFTPSDGFILAPTESGDGGWGVSAESNNTLGSPGYNQKTGGGGGDRTCFGCGEVGHNKRDCPKGGPSSDRACFGCGEVGHTKRDCLKGGSGKGGQACFNCGLEGHRKADCTEPMKPRAGGGGGGRTCFNCLQPGHNASDCTEPRVERCRNCDAEGHHSRDCPQPKDWSRVKCKNCYKFGHGEKRCPEPAGGTSTYGGGSGDWCAPADSGAAAGGWENGADSNAATGGWGGEDAGEGSTDNWAQPDAGTGGTDNWADQANAEAQW